MSIAQTYHDKRIDEILQLANEEGRPLALSPQTIIALEDHGWIADPFTGQLWPDPAQKQTTPTTTVLLAEALYRIWGGE